MTESRLFYELHSLSHSRWRVRDPSLRMNGFSQERRLGRMVTRRRLAVFDLRAGTSISFLFRLISFQLSRAISAARSPANAPMAMSGISSEGALLSKARVCLGVRTP